uniref:Uncharacterized protein n=1 Tax=Vitrella brassicaformis TaxID=1169539 RepID=A0A7S1KCR0_9ALVE
MGGQHSTHVITSAASVFIWILIEHAYLHTHIRALRAMGVSEPYTPRHDEGSTHIHPDASQLSIDTMDGEGNDRDETDVDDQQHDDGHGEGVGESEEVKRSTSNASSVRAMRQQIEEEICSRCCPCDDDEWSGGAGVGVAIDIDIGVSIVVMPEGTSDTDRDRDREGQRQGEREGEGGLVAWMAKLLWGGPLHACSSCCEGNGTIP